MQPLPRSDEYALESRQTACRLLQGVVSVHVDAETHPQNLRFTCCEAAKHFLVASVSLLQSLINGLRSSRLR